MFKTNQVLRTRVPLSTLDEVQIPPTTRVVVTSVDKETNKVRAKVADSNSPLLGKKLLAGPGAFNKTHRGRPKGSVKKKAEFSNHTWPV